MSPQINLVIGLLMIWASMSMSRPSISHDAIIAAKHKQWMTHHSRSYNSTSEKQKRFQIFKANLKYIESINNAPNKTYKLSLNKFSDLNDEEFAASYTGFNMHVADFPVGTDYTPTAEMENEVPESIDWREEGVVTPVKTQGRCGCCWAFSAVTAIEGLIGNGVSLSAQQLVDCVTSSHGCNGGWMNAAFDYVIRNQGIASENQYYPYQRMQGYCDTRRTSFYSSAQITSYRNVWPSEQALKIAVANQPVSVALSVSPNFRHYSSGVYDGRDCGYRLNHAVAIVGYGAVAEDGTKYWIIKNQWGESWGMGGYMMLLRDVGIPGGVCGVARAASYPVV